MTAKFPKVAIITRTKDRRVFLERALQSVHNQTYDDYVHVIVNDGGDKGPVDELVDSLSPEQLTKTKVFHRETSSGAPDTIFNESIDRTDSEYVVIHDDDDTWNENFLKETVAVLDAGAMGVVVRTDRVIEEIDGSTIEMIKRERYMPDMKVVSLYKQCIDNQLTPIAFVFSRKAYEEVGKFDSSLPVVGDWEFGIRFLQKYDVTYLDPGYPLANYHHRKSNRDNSFARHDHLTYFTQVANKYLRDDIAKGKFGVGYIINDLKYRQSSRGATIKRILPSWAVSQIKKRLR